MTTNDEANSAQIAEIRARAERFVRPATAGDRDQWAVWDMARDVLALLDVAGAAQALIELENLPVAVMRTTLASEHRDAVKAAQARLEEALKPFIQAESGGL